MRKSFIKKILLVAGTIIVIACLAQRTLFFESGALEYYSSYIVYPALIIQRYVATPIKSYFEKRKNVSDLEKQMQVLQQERDDLLAKNIELQGLISFAQDTQELVEFKQRYTISAVLAHVLVKNFSEQSHFFLIDRGSKSGVQKDMIVTYKDCLIGKIIEIYPYYSKVLLISDQSCKVAAYCAQSKASGIYQGCNEEWSASLNHISHLSTLEQGELILSSGDGLVFPRGFGLGKIKSFKTKDLFYEVMIEPLIDLHAITYCYVMQKGSHLENQSISQVPSVNTAILK